MADWSRFRPPPRPADRAERRDGGAPHQLSHRNRQGLVSAASTIGESDKTLQLFDMGLEGLAPLARQIYPSVLPALRFPLTQSHIARHSSGGAAESKKIDEVGGDDPRGQALGVCEIILDPVATTDPI